MILALVVLPSSGRTQPPLLLRHRDILPLQLVTQLARLFRAQLDAWRQARHGSEPGDSAPDLVRGTMVLLEVYRIKYATVGDVHLLAITFTSATPFSASVCVSQAVRVLDGGGAQTVSERLRDHRDDRDILSRMEALLHGDFLSDAERQQDDYNVDWNSIRAEAEAGDVRRSALESVAFTLPESIFASAKQKARSLAMASARRRGVESLKDGTYAAAMPALNVAHDGDKVVAERSAEVRSRENSNSETTSDADAASEMSNSESDTSSAAPPAAAEPLVYVGELKETVSCHYDKGALRQLKVEGVLTFEPRESEFLFRLQNVDHVLVSAVRLNPKCARAQPDVRDQYVSTSATGAPAMQYACAITKSWQPVPVAVDAQWQQVSDNDATLTIRVTPREGALRSVCVAVKLQGVNSLVQCSPTLDEGASLASGLLRWDLSSVEAEQQFSATVRFLPAHLDESLLASPVGLKFASGGNLSGLTVETAAVGSDANFEDALLRHSLAAGTYSAVPAVVMHAEAEIDEASPWDAM